MEIEALTIFIKAAELLHFGKASRACNLSPSALTRMIQRFEEEVGHSLFLRDNRRVVLTDAGRSFLIFAREAVQEWQHFRETLATNLETIGGTLSIYASITAVYSLLPELLEAYRVAYPSVHLDLRTGVAERAVEQVLDGGADLAVAALPDRVPDHIEFRPLIETPLVFIAARNFLVPRGPLDLSQLPLVVPQSGVARQRLDQWLRENELVPKISSEASGNEALIALVRLGAGIGIVPRLVLERSPFRKEIRVLARAPTLAPYTVGLCAATRTLQRPAVQAMWKLAGEPRT